MIDTKGQCLAGEGSQTMALDHSVLSLDLHLPWEIIYCSCPQLSFLGRVSNVTKLLYDVENSNKKKLHRRNSSVIRTVFHRKE